MLRRLRVLFVDDDPVDVELAEAALRHEFDVESSCVESADRFTDLVRDGVPEVILCDYAMPRFSGLEALALWKELGAAGATDYVLKGNLARLPTAVDRALREFAAARVLRETEAERARVAAAIEQAEEAVVITDRDGRIVYVNPGFTRITGYGAEEVTGKTPALLKSGQNDPALYADLWWQINAGEVWRGELINRRRDGGLYHAELTIAPVFDPSGRIVNFSAIQRDVSERVAAERKLRELYAELAQTDRLKDEFLAAFSHELRSPLHVILGYVEVLKEGLGPRLDPESDAMIEAILDNANHLTELINETLDVARLRIGALQPHFAAFDVAALVRETVRAFAPLAQAKGLRLSCDVPEEQVEVTSDALRLRQILGNLLDNAIKFTERGEVRVHEECRNGTVAIEVRDTGIGVGAADIPLMFEDFRQLDGSTTRRYGGCGLGLAVSKRLLSLLGGSIDVESEPGRGSSFLVQVPRIPPSAANEAGSEPGSD